MILKINLFLISASIAIQIWCGYNIFAFKHLKHIKICKIHSHESRKYCTIPNRNQNFKASQSRNSLSSFRRKLELLENLSTQNRAMRMSIEAAEKNDRSNIQSREIFTTRNLSRPNIFDGDSSLESNKSTLVWDDIFEFEMPQKFPVVDFDYSVDISPEIPDSESIIAEDCINNNPTPVTNIVESKEFFTVAASSNGSEIMDLDNPTPQPTTFSSIFPRKSIQSTNAHANMADYNGSEVRLNISSLNTSANSLQSFKKIEEKLTSSRNSYTSPMDSATTLPERAYSESKTTIDIETKQDNSMSYVPAELDTSGVENFVSKKSNSNMMREGEGSSPPSTRITSTLLEKTGNFAKSIGMQSSQSKSDKSSEYALSDDADGSFIPASTTIESFPSSVRATETSSTHIVEDVDATTTLNTAPEAYSPHFSPPSKSLPPAVLQLNLQKLELEERLAIVKASLSSSHAREESLKDQCMALSEDLESERSQRDALTKTNIELEATVATLSRDRAAVQKELDALRSPLLSLTQERNALEKDLAALRARERSLVGQCENLGDALKIEREKEAELIATKESLAHKVDILSIERDTVTAELNSLRGPLLNLTKERNALKKSLDESLQSGGASSQRVIQLERDLSSVREKATALMSLKGRLEQRVDALAGERDSVATELSSLRAPLQDLTRERNLLQETLRGVQSSLEEAQSRCATLSDELAAEREKGLFLLTRRNELELTVGGLMTERQAILTNLTALEQSSIVLEEERNALLTELKSSQQRERELQKSTTSLRRELAAERDLRLRLETIRADLEDKVRSLTVERDAALTEADSLREPLHTLTAQRDSLRTELSASQANATALATQLQCKEMEAAAQLAGITARYREIEGIEKSLAMTEQLVVELRADKEALEEKVQVTTLEASSGTARVLHLQAEIASLLDKLDERTARLQKVQIELAELKSAQGNLLAEKGEINAKLRKAVEESGSLSFKINELKSDLAASRKRLESTTQSLGEAQAEISEKDYQLQKILTRRVEFQSEIDRLESELTTAKEVVELQAKEIGEMRFMLQYVSMSSKSLLPSKSLMEKRAVAVAIAAVPQVNGNEEDASRTSRRVGGGSSGSGGGNYADEGDGGNDDASDFAGNVQADPGLAAILSDIDTKYPYRPPTNMRTGIIGSASSPANTEDNNDDSYDGGYDSAVGLTQPNSAGKFSSSSSSSSSLSPPSEEVRSAAAIAGGVMGFLVGGPVGGLASAAVANFVASSDNDGGEVVRGFGKALLGTRSFLGKVDRKYRLTNMTTNWIESLPGAASMLDLIRDKSDNDGNGDNSGDDDTVRGGEGSSGNGTAVRSAFLFRGGDGGYYDSEDDDDYQASTTKSDTDDDSCGDDNGRPLPPPSMVPAAAFAEAVDDLAESSPLIVEEDRERSGQWNGVTQIAQLGSYHNTYERDDMLQQQQQQQQEDEQRLFADLKKMDTIAIPGASRTSTTTDEIPDSDPQLTVPSIRWASSSPSSSSVPAPASAGSEEVAQFSREDDGDVDEEAASGVATDAAQYARSVISTIRQLGRGKLDGAVGAGVSSFRPVLGG